MHRNRSHHLEHLPNTLIGIMSKSLKMKEGQEMKAMALLREGDRKLHKNFFRGKDRWNMRKLYRVYVLLQVIVTAVAVFCAGAQIELARDSANRPDEATVYLLIYVSIVCSIVIFILILLRYFAKYNSFAIRVSYNIGFLRFLKVRGKLASFFFEIAFVWILPYVPDPYVSNWLIIFMFLRALYPCVLLANYSYLTWHKQEITENLKLFQQRSPKFGMAMKLRSFFKSSGEFITALLYIGLILFFAYLFYSSGKLADLTAEEPNNYPYEVTIYWALVTATTVGYGDILPVDSYQQALAISCAVLGVILSSLLMGFITSKMNLAPNEILALRVAEQRQLIKKRNNAAARAIQYMIRINNFSLDTPVHQGRVTEIKRYMEMETSMMRALAELEQTQVILKNSYNFDPNARANTDSETLLKRAEVIDRYYEKMKEQVQRASAELKYSIDRLQTAVESKQ